ncbi:MAG: hypothetical protein ACEPOW_13825 [Bacteroidales bacterium]
MVKKKTKQLSDTIGLLNSMVCSGEEPDGFFVTDEVVETLCKFKDAPPYWSFKPLTSAWFYNNNINYNDLNGDSGRFHVRSSIGIIDILHGEEGFSYNYSIELKTIHDFLGLYKSLSGECFDIVAYE